ncbi:hypothetical protein FJZ39_00150 [Candidatus Saccharibacteria bacterium]|nr:hypothetical protein [Candidatus Saccharibacteria bacterium]
MSDIDFDELDKAVQSLMEKHDTIRDASPSTQQDSVSGAVSDEESNSVVTPAPAPSLQRHASPRIMDVVRPKTQSVSSRINVTSPVSRSSRTLNPVGADTTAQNTERDQSAATKSMDIVRPRSSFSYSRTPVQTNDAIEPQTELISTRRSTAVTVDSFADTAAAEMLLDNLSIASFDEPDYEDTVTTQSKNSAKDYSGDDVTVPKSDTSATQLTTASNESEEQDRVEKDSTPEPQAQSQSQTLNAEDELDSYSPFLPDATSKVEKRPLGMRDELDDDMVAEELQFAGPQVAKPQPEIATNDVAEVESESGMVNPNEPTPVAGQVANPTVLSLQSGLSKEDDNEDSGSIYDPHTYHQPLAHPERVRSGWWSVLWIVALLLIGAASGAAYFLLVQ